MERMQRDMSGLLSAKRMWTKKQKNTVAFPPSLHGRLGFYTEFDYFRVIIYSKAKLWKFSNGIWEEDQDCHIQIKNVLLKRLESETGEDCLRHDTSMKAAPIPIFSESQNLSPC